MAAEPWNNDQNIFMLKSQTFIWYYCSPTETQKPVEIAVS